MAKNCSLLWDENAVAKFSQMVAPIGEAECWNTLPANARYSDINIYTFKYWPKTSETS